ncbi:MAG: hypothetical protein FJ278_11165, partial [Planctomycetes bacterium]|nr:hypothetical protein [Planctomycetota bacterium]
MRVPFVVLILACLSLTAFSEVKVGQMPNAVAIWTDATKLAAKLEGGRASGFDLVDVKSGRVLARIELGANGDWRATCSAEAGVLAFTALDTEATGGATAFDKDSHIRVELRDGDPFPLVSFRLRMASVGKESLDFLICRMDSAQVFYRGGSEMPCPTLDPFPMTSASTGGWTFSAPMAACPVPAVGLWDAASSFVGYEFQDARTTDRSDKGIGTAYCAAQPEGKGQFMALLMPPQGAESRFRLIYSTQMPASASPNEFVLGHIWKTYRDRLTPAPAVNDLGWMPRREQFTRDDGTTNSLLRRVAKNALDEESL